MTTPPLTDRPAYTPHEPRLDLAALAPAFAKAQATIGAAVRASGIEPALGELIKIRASQINGCAFCLDMHIQDAAAMGETAPRLHLLAVWRDAPFYTDRERAALALTEAVTLVATDGVPDDVWSAAAAIFSPQELAGVLMAIVVINSWNRMGIATGLTAGIYHRTAEHP